MIQKTFDGYCIVVDDISVCRERENKELKPYEKMSNNTTLL
jgi:hypothetical protein